MAHEHPVFDISSFLTRTCTHQNLCKTHVIEHHAQMLCGQLHEARTCPHPGAPRHGSFEGFQAPAQLCQWNPPVLVSDGPQSCSSRFRSFAVQILLLCMSCLRRKKRFMPVSCLRCFIEDIAAMLSNSTHQPVVVCESPENKRGTRVLPQFQLFFQVLHRGAKEYMTYWIQDCLCVHAHM